MRKILLIANLAWFTIHAQHFSELERFAIDYAKGCAPVTISVTTLNKSEEPPNYLYEGNIENPSLDTFYTYTEPGIYSIVQLPANDQCVDCDSIPKTDTLIFEVLPPVPPQFNIFQCSATEVQVEVTDNEYDYYVIHFTHEDSVIYTPPEPPPAYNYEQNSGNVQVTGYYYDSYPTCGDSFQTFNIDTSAEVALLSASISQGCQNDFFLNIEAETDPFTKYQIEFSQDNGSYQLVYEGAMHQTHSTHAIPFDISRPSWCVRINRMNSCTREVTTGDATCDTIDPASFSPLSGAYATYQDAAILIHISATLGNEILLSRRSGNSASFSLVHTINESYTDDIPSQRRSFEYKLVQQDTCGNKADSLFLAAPYIRFIDKNKHEKTVTISSEDPLNELGDFEKSLIIYNADSSVVVELPYDDLINLPPEAGSRQNIRTCYQYTGSGIRLFSNELTTNYETTIFVPEAFTPNGDLLNDRLELFGLPTNEYEISIFNRWGELIHQSVNTNPVWDGRINQQPAPEGTYQYRLNFKLSTGEVKSQVGTFVLLKK